MITGFAGGALAAHLRVTQAVILPEIINVALGGGAWAGCGCVTLVYARCFRCADRTSREGTEPPAA